MFSSCDTPACASEQEQGLQDGLRVTAVNGQKWAEFGLLVYFLQHLIKLTRAWFKRAISSLYIVVR